MKKFLTILFLITSVFAAKNELKTINNYSSNTFFDLRTIDIIDVNGIKQKDEKCVLFKNNTNIYCQLEDKKDILINLTTDTGEIDLLIINSQFVTKQEFEKSITVEEKYEKCLKENKNLNIKNISLANENKNHLKNYASLEKEYNQVNEEVSDIRLKLKVKSKSAQKTSIDIKRTCERERTELLSIMQGKVYKDLKDYSVQNQIIFELEKTRTKIKTLQREYLDILKENENLKSKIKDMENNNINASKFVD